MNILAKASKPSSWLVGRISGAGFASTIFVIYLLVASFNLFLFGNTLKNPLFWISFFGVGVITSGLIDFLTNSFPITKIILYMFIGGLTSIMMVELYVSIAALIGICFSLLFYMGTVMANRISWFKWTFASMPIVIFFLLLPDYTIKQEWNTIVGEGSYSAYFSYFNGKDTVPIKAEEGDKIIVELDFKNVSGQYNYQLLDDKDRMVTYTIKGDNLTFAAEKTATYCFIVNGDSLKGGYEIRWKKE